MGPVEHYKANPVELDVQRQCSNHFFLIFINSVSSRLNNCYLVNAQYFKLSLSLLVLQHMPLWSTQPLM